MFARNTFGMAFVVAAWASGGVVSAQPVTPTPADPPGAPPKAPEAAAEAAPAVPPGAAEPAPDAETAEPAPDAETAEPAPDAETAEPAPDVGAAEGAESSDAKLPPAPQAPPPAVCAPACSEGYVCQEGTCVSGCYPPCGPGDTCRQGTCSSTAPAAGATDSGPRQGRKWDWDEALAETDRPQGYRIHDGFMLRMALTIGGGAMSFSTPDEHRTHGGFAAQLSIDLGGSVTDNLVVFGRLSSNGWERGLEDVDPAEDADPDDTRDARSKFESGLIGVGVSYYVVPINIYVGAVLGVFGGALQDVDDDRVQDVDMRVEGGRLFQVEVGKEWWISANWALGLGLRFTIGGAEGTEQLPENDMAREAIEEAGGPHTTDISFWSVGLVHSATYQ